MGLCLFVQIHTYIEPITSYIMLNNQILLFIVLLCFLGCIGCEYNDVFYSFLYSIVCCSVLFCSVLFCSVLYCSVLLCYVLYSICILYYILFYSPFLSILFYSILFYSILFYSILFYSILFYSIRRCRYWSELFDHFCTQPTQLVIKIRITSCGFSLFFFF